MKDLNEHIKRRLKVIKYFKSMNMDEEVITIEKELLSLLIELKARRIADAKKDK